MTLSVRTGRRLLLGAAVLAAAAACGDDTPEINAPDLAGSELFRSYVSLGNSLTAGWQASGINDSTQRESYAFLLARAAGLTPGQEWIYPSFAAPGCPPPVTNFRTLSRGSLPGSTTPATGTTCLLRNATQVSTRLNNVAVPTAFAWDLTRSATPTSAANPLQTLVLGGRTQLQRALEARPTFASLWIGNNEALGPASVGKLTPVAGASPGAIPVDTVRRYVAAAVDTLVAAPTLRGGVLIGVVDVRNAPRLFPADSLFRAGAPSPLKFSIDSTTGRTVTVLPNCVGSRALISAEIIPQIRAGTYPPVISSPVRETPSRPSRSLTSCVASGGKSSAKAARSASSRSW